MPAATVSPERQAAQVEAWLAHFLRPGQASEVRTIWGPRKARSAFFNHAHLADMARHAVQMESTAWDAGTPFPLGVYFTPNPLQPDLLGTRRSANDGHVLARHWLLIDVDPFRFGPDGARLEGEAARVSTTDAERDAAWAVLARVRGTLEAAGFRQLIVGDSGNGWHLCAPLDLPANEHSREEVRALLRGLHARCSDERAEVDTTTFNASRIWKLYGTRSRKGVESAERPHRWSRLVEVPS